MPKKIKKPGIKNLLGFAKKYFRKYRREGPAIILVSALLIFAVLALGRLWGWWGNSAENKFDEARSGFETSLEEIVSLTKTSKEALGAIDSERQAGNYDRVLEMVKIESERNNALKEKGYNLSADLRIMAENLGGLKPAEVVEEGFQAVDRGLDIFQTTLDHTKYTENFLEATEKWARGERTTEVSDDIENSLSLSQKRADKLDYLAGRYKRDIADFDKAREER